jgi:hypothetical protein
VNEHGTPTSTGRPPGFTRHVTWVILTLSAGVIVAAPIAYAFRGVAGATAVALAALVCALASSVAAVAGNLISKRGHVLAATLLPMLLRMALPLAFCTVVQFRRHGPLVDNGLALYVVGFYMLTLATDTWLSVGRPPIGVGLSREL